MFEWEDIISHEDAIRKNYHAWETKNRELMMDVFSSDCYYNECLGDEYNGESQILRWFDEWNEKGTVAE